MGPQQGVHSVGVATHHILSFMVCLDFGIPEDPATEARMKVADVTEPLWTLVPKRLDFYCHIIEATNRCSQEFWAISTLESLETEHKAVTSETVGKRLKVEDLIHAGQELVLKSAGRGWWPASSGRPCIQRMRTSSLASGKAGHKDRPHPDGSVALSALSRAVIGWLHAQIAVGGAEEGWIRPTQAGP